LDSRYPALQRRDHAGTTIKASGAPTFVTGAAHGFVAAPGIVAALLAKTF